MTESEWQACTDPLPMLEFLKGKASNRKLRLFAVACCRRVQNRTANSRFHQIIDTAEKYADGLVGRTDLTLAEKIARASRTGPADAAAWDAVDPNVFDAALQAAQHASWATGTSSRADERRVQAALLRDIFGFSFRYLALLESTALTWNDSTVPRLADSIYIGRFFDHLPILADALEEAGCTDMEILDHCRHPLEHVRGCWVVDLILGIE